MSRVTIKDVAARAGVSYQTVSRAMNRPETVAAPTLARIDAAAAELDWEPSTEARLLQSRRRRPTAEDGRSADETADGRGAATDDERIDVHVPTAPQPVRHP